MTLVERLAAVARRASKSPSHVEVMRAGVLAVVADLTRDEQVEHADRLLAVVEQYDSVKGPRR